MQASVQDKLAGALGAAIVVTLLGYGLLLGMAVEIHVRGEQPMTLLTLMAPPRPKPPRPLRLAERQKPSHASGRASPRNLRNKATEVVAPHPLVVLPAPSSVVVAPKAGLGMAASAGASDKPGPGQGAGGQGNGTGSGGYGEGDGGGGGGDVPPRRIRGGLKYSDLPPALRDGGFEGTVSVEYDVEVDGRVSDCTVTASSGSTELDQLTCQLIRQRFRFDPSRDRDGRRVPSTIAENHRWAIDRTDDPR